LNTENQAMSEGKVQIHVSFACCAALATSLLLIPWDIYSLAYAHETLDTLTQVAVSGINLTAHLCWMMLQVVMLAMSEEHCIVSKSAMEKVVMAMATVPFISMIAFVLQIYSLSESGSGTVLLWVYLIFIGWILFPAIQFHLISVLIEHHELFVENGRVQALLTKRVRVVCLVIACVVGNVSVCVLDPIVNKTNSDFGFFFYVLMTLSTALAFVLSWCRRRNIMFLMIWVTLQIMTFAVGCYVGWQIQLTFFGRATGLTQCVWLSYVAMITAAISSNVLLLITVAVNGLAATSPRQAYEEMLSYDVDRL